MYIPDVVNAPLCGHCLERFTEGNGPPWKPAAQERCANMLEAAFTSARVMLSRESIELVASFLRSTVEP